MKIKRGQVWNAVEPHVFIAKIIVMRAPTEHIEVLVRPVDPAFSWTGDKAINGNEILSEYVYSHTLSELEMELI